MFVNSSLAAAQTPIDRLAKARTTASADREVSENGSAGVSSALMAQADASVAAPANANQADSIPGQLAANAEDLSAALPEITSPAEAQAGVAAALNHLLHHSTSALLAQGGHTPQSVLALLAQ